MEACSPGVGNHSRRERTGNNPDIERKKQKRIFNRLIHELIIHCKKLRDIDMIDGKGIDKNGGMYALDEIKISYAEAVKAGPIPSSSKEQKNKKTGSKDNRTRDKTRVAKKTRPKWINDLKPETSIDPKSNGYNTRIDPKSNSKPDESLILNGRTIKTQSPISNGKRLRDKGGASLILNGRTIKTHNLD